MRFCRGFLHGAARRRANRGSGQQQRPCRQQRRHLIGAQRAGQQVALAHIDAEAELDRVAATADAHYDFADNSGGASPPVIGLTYEYVVTAYNETNGNESGHSVMATCTSASVPDSP